MNQRNFMAAMDILDEAQAAKTEAAFVPVIELSAGEERDAEAEIAGFVNRPERTGRVETSSSKTCIGNGAGAGTGKTPFSEAAGFSDTSL